MRARATLEQALAILRGDAPAAYARLLAELDGLTVALQVDGERFALRGAEFRLHFDDGGGAALIDLRTTRRTIVALIDGELSLLDAVLARTLAVRAEARQLDRIARAGRHFADGALRSRRMRALLDRFRADEPSAA